MAVKKEVKIYDKDSILYGANLSLYTESTSFALIYLEKSSIGNIIKRHKNSTEENKYILTGITKAKNSPKVIIII